MKKVPIVASILALASPALGNGFILNDHGASATGRANAVTATVDDGSAIVYNPAGLAVRTGTNIYFGGSLVLPDSEFTPDRTGVEVDNDGDFAVTPTFFAYHRIHELVAAGIGVHAPFGSTVEWGPESPARDEIRKQTLRTLFITPSVAFNLGRYVPGLTIGGGVDLVPASVELERDILFGTEIGTAELAGDGFGVGGRIGAMYNPDYLRQLSVGIAWRSEVKLDFDGEGDFDAPPPFRSVLPPDGDISTEVTLPQSVLAGIAYRPIPPLELEFNVQWMGWSSFDELRIELPDGTEAVSPRNWDDTTTYRAGAEYDLDFGLDLRGGYAYDPTPMPSTTLTPSLPDKDRHVVFVGAGYDLPWQNGVVDFGALWVLPGDRETSDAPNAPPIKGTFDVEAFVIALSVGFQFGATDEEEAVLVKDDKKKKGQKDEPKRVASK